MSTRRSDERAPRIVRTLDDLDAQWLAGALGCGAIASFDARAIGTGQMSQSHRVRLVYEDGERAGPQTVVLKLAADDPGSRATGVGLGIYEREVRFYDELAPRIGGPLPACSFARYDEREGWFTLLLEDASEADVGDQIAGCSIEQAGVAVRALARLHAPVLGDERLAASGWLNRESPIGQALVQQLLPGFLERYGERVAPAHVALCERLVASLDAWLGERHGPQGLVHGDFRLDNLLFGRAGAPRALTVVDWQTVAWGGAVTDASYFLGGSLSVEDRRAGERELLGEYHQALLAQGVQSLSWEVCWREYRRAAFAGTLMAIVASMLVERTERGDEMFVTMLARHAQHALDVDAAVLLARPDKAPVAPLRPAPQDERRHTAGSEPLWNESWYFDAIAADGSVGAYVRVGLYPQLGVCWYTALVCGPGRATVAAIDFAAPLPTGEQLELRTDALQASHRCEQPLQRFSVALDATGEAHDDPAALLRGERGRELAISLALTWSTAGEPYSYRLATRYEIPCTVSGTIDLGGERLELTDALGQRDHSWGTRDWWAMDWMWSAAHLDDGTHVHAVQLRLPGAPPIGVGYSQRANDPLLELTGVRAREIVAEDGLVAQAQIALEPGGIEMAVEPIAHAPLRLQSSDGRVSHFPRSLCRLRCADGRAGLGWVEWNLNQPRPGDAG
jgi:hypothetical protein